MTTPVVDTLRDQHRRITGLFQRVASPDEDRPAVLRDLITELSAHVAAERASIGPLGHRHELGEMPAWLDADYDRMEQLLVLIERRKFNSPDLPDLVTELKAASEAHADRSERELFPELERRLSPEEQMELADKLNRSDDIVASHPHPHLLSLGPLADLMTRLAARWDRARDRTATNRQHPEDLPKMHQTGPARAWAGLRRGRSRRSLP